MTPKFLSRRTALLGASATVLLSGVGFGQVADRPVEGGIGGTGIVGILTEFGSLIIGAARVLTDANTRYFDGFGDLSESEVEVGQALTVEAVSTSHGLLAKRVLVTYPLVGQVSHIGDHGRLWRVNGTDVVVTHADAHIAPGARVAVSGLWDGPRVIASRVQPTREARDLVSGTVSKQGFSCFVGPVRVRRGDQTALTNRGFGTAIGRFDPTQGQFVAQRLSPNRFTGAAGRLRQLAIEGYLEPVEYAPGYQISGLGHSFTRDLDLQRFAQHRVLFRGGYDGLFRPQTGHVLPEDPSARRDALSRLREG